jgi:hypothetical protein
MRGEVTNILRKRCRYGRFDDMPRRLTKFVCVDDEYKINDEWSVQIKYGMDHRNKSSNCCGCSHRLLRQMDDSKKAGRWLGVICTNLRRGCRQRHDSARNPARYRLYDGSAPRAVESSFSIRRRLPSSLYNSTSRCECFIDQSHKQVIR